MKKRDNSGRLIARLMFASAWVLMMVPPVVHAEDSPPTRQQMLEQTDRNHDGRIDRAERGFARADRNHDGALDDAEKAARKEHLSRIDKNNDGHIGPRERAFNGADRNHDGHLGPVERHAAQRHRPHRPL